MADKFPFGSRRGAIKAAPNDFARCVLLGNLGALFLSAGKLNEALATLHHSIEMGIQIGSIAKSNTAGGAISLLDTKSRFRIRMCRGWKGAMECVI